MVGKQQSSIQQITDTLPPIKYVLEYGKEKGWTSRMDKKSAEERVIRAVTEAKSSFNAQAFCNAMDACCELFGPATPKDVRPWYQHLLNDRSDRNGKIEEEEFLLNIATEPWPLDWYWKVLVTSLTDWPRDPEGQLVQKIYIKLSQVRSWVMLSVLKEKEPDGDGEKMTLVRPPIFGRSKRLVDWDQYWLYLLNADRIIEEWRICKEAPLIEQAYIVGRHDIEYSLELNGIDSSVPGKIEVEIKGDLKLTPYIDGDNPEQLSSDRRKQVRWDPYDFIKIPVFSKRAKKQDSDPAVTTGDGESNTLVHGDTTSNLRSCPSSSAGDEESTASIKELPFLIASDRVCEALELLCDVWNDPTIKMVHLNAPPGSGKDELKKTIYRCCKREGEEEVVSLSPHDTEENTYVLLGRPLNVQPKHQTAKRKGNYEKGLIEKARSGVLILDEIDKVEEATRTVLLRVLESEKFAVPGTNEERPISNPPLYVFLSSMPIIEIYARRGPPDFWTRIPFTVEMKHPFDIDDSLARENALQQYLWMFWNQHISKHHKKLEEDLKLEKSKQIKALVILLNKPISVHCSDMCSRTRGESTNQAGLNLVTVLGYFENIKAFLSSNAFVTCVTHALAREIHSRYGNISVRNLRSITARCVFKFLQWVLYSRVFWASEASDYKKLRDRLENMIYLRKYDRINTDLELKREIESIARSALEQRVDYPG